MKSLYNDKLLILVFRSVVWLCILGTIPIASLALWFVITRHPEYSKPPGSIRLNNLHPGSGGGSLLPFPRLEAVYFQVLGACCSQGENIKIMKYQVTFCNNYINKGSPEIGIVPWKLFQVTFAKYTFRYR